MHTEISRNPIDKKAVPIWNGFNLHEMSKKGILLADGKKEVRDESRNYLTKAGFIVDTVKNGGLAYEKIYDGLTRYNVLITAHYMPKLDGEGLIKKLRSEDLDNDLLIILTAYPEEINLTQKIAALLNVNILSKPLNYQSLPDVITNLIQKKEGRNSADYVAYTKGLVDEVVDFTQPQKPTRRH